MGVYRVNEAGGTDEVYPDALSDTVTIYCTIVSVPAEVSQALSKVTDIELVVSGILVHAV
jgi:hypothetical protein